jgi:hypothetical protein
MLKTKSHTVGDLTVQLQLHKKKTTNRMQEDIINKITWAMWETHVEGMGMWLEDPKLLNLNKAALSQAKNFFSKNFNEIPEKDENNSQE